MSGHSKWSTIKRQKGVNDAKRGQQFTKLSIAITLAVKQGGGISDPSSNLKLRLAVEAAKNANMPKDNIERAIERAAGKNASEMTEVLYEGFGPAGMSIIVEAITDNKQRTTPEIKSIFDKNGGTLGVQGSVGYQFEQKGQITVGKNGHSFDEVFLIAAEQGAEDVEDVGDELVVYTQPDSLAKVKDSLVEVGLVVTSAELIRKPIVLKQVAASDADKVYAFLEKLESLDDVQNVYANYDILEGE